MTVTVSCLILFMREGWMVEDREEEAREGVGSGVGRGGGVNHIDKENRVKLVSFIPKFISNLTKQTINCCRPNKTLS